MAIRKTTKLGNICLLHLHHFSTVQEFTAVMESCTMHANARDAVLNENVVGDDSWVKFVSLSH